MQAWECTCGGLNAGEFTDHSVCRWCRFEIKIPARRFLLVLLSHALLARRSEETH
jgi:hypothetical protein